MTIHHMYNLQLEYLTAIYLFNLVEREIRRIDSSIDIYADPEDDLRRLHTIRSLLVKQLNRG